MNVKVTLVTDAEITNAENNEELKPICEQCNSTNVYGQSRVVGYFSIIENWNRSKKAELKRRQRGNY